MNSGSKIVGVLGLLVLGGVQAASNAIDIPRDKIQMFCSDDYFKSSRANFVLEDERYGTCKLKLSLALRQKWPDARRFYILPRVTVELVSQSKAAPVKVNRTPLTSFGNPQPDTLHRLIPVKDFQTVDLFMNLSGNLQGQVAENFVAQALGVSGKLTVCADPIGKGEDPCLTYNVIARFKIYRK